MRAIVARQASWLIVEQCEAWEEEIYGARRRSRTASDETPKGLVMWIAVSCGNRERRRAELDFRRRESIDDFHGPSALGAKPKIVRTRCRNLGLGWWCCAEQRKAEWEGGGTSAARKEAEVPNAHEAFGKHVQQEAAQEFIER
jgi:hypothetical protein